MDANNYMDPSFIEFMRQLTLQQNAPTFNQNQYNSMTFDPTSDVQIDIDSKENIKKEIVIFNVAEHRGRNHRTADFQTVMHILSSINASLNVKLVRRLGKYSSKGKPRRILVLFNEKQDQRSAVNNAHKLENIPEFKHVNIKAYRPHDKRDNHEKKSHKIKKVTESLKKDSDELPNPFINFASKINPHKEINILVIGASGVGKSTWINGLANYMNFNTFEDALNAEYPKCLIPMKFHIFNGEDNEEFNVNMEATMGVADVNEGKQDAGQSCTQQPKAYHFVTNSFSFNLIDTPGICDTRGIEYDIENIKMVMECLSEWEEIHGVCLLLKPKENRLNLGLHYCLEELLVNLHKNSIPNIAVVFTNSSGSFNRPGETLTLLHDLVKKVQAANQNFIRIEDENTFCIENESVKTLYANYNYAELDDDEIDRCNESWNHTVAQTYRMFEYFSKQHPHSADETKATSKVRGILTELLTIMADINNEIVQNKRIFDEQTQQLKAFEKIAAEKQNNTYQGEYIEKTTLSSPVTVCCGQNCTETIVSSKTNSTEIYYKKICCSPCPVKNVPQNQNGHVNLRSCTAFDSSANCKTCGCSWQQHMHISYSQKKLKGEFTNTTNPQGSNTLNIQITAKSKHIQQLKTKIEDFEKNYQSVMKLCYPFLNFLAENSIILFNSRFTDYVDQEIMNITNSGKVGENRVKVDMLQKFLAIAEQQKCVITEKSTSDGKGIQEITMKNYMDSIKSLENHEIVGPLLKESFGYQRLFESLNFKMIRCATKIKRH